MSFPIDTFQIQEYVNYMPACNSHFLPRGPPRGSAQAVSAQGRVSSRDPRGQNNRHVQKHYIAATTLWTVLNIILCTYVHRCVVEFSFYKYPSIHSTLFCWPIIQHNNLFNLPLNKTYKWEIEEFRLSCPKHAHSGMVSSCFCKLNDLCSSVRMFLITQWTDQPVIVTSV